MERSLDRPVTGANNYKPPMPTREWLLQILSDHLEEFSLWDKSVAIRRAAADGVTLEEDHWYVIESLREFYGEYSVSPFLTMFSHYLLVRDADERLTATYLKVLFPDDGISRACRYAGLPEPVRRCCT